VSTIGLGAAVPLPATGVSDRPLGPVSIKDVAKAAGVAQGTVSNVLNHPERVAAARRARVLEAIDALGFVRNESARQLRAGSSRTLGLLLMDVWNPFFTEMARGIEDFTAERGWTILTSNSARRADREAAYFKLFAERRVEGVLVAPVGPFAEQVDNLKKKGIACIVIDQADLRPGAMSVSMDNLRGGRLAAEHLVALGCRRIALVGSPSRVTQVKERVDGAGAVFSQAAPGISTRLWEPEDLTISAGRLMGEQIVNQHPDDRPDAIFACSDLLAIGIMRVLIDHHIKVPQEIAIVGYDDNEFAREMAIPLTTVRQPAYDIGVVAARMLTAHIGGESIEESRVVFTPKLIVRASTVMQ